jgi:nucleoside-diphosphate-sugar epimerase
MKILILGGTGAMGIHLTHILSQRNDSIYITSRQNLTSFGNVHYLLGNAHNLTFIKQILASSWDAIIDFMIYSTEEFKERYDLFLNATPQYVFLSSARVYANDTSPITDKSARLLDTCQDTAFLQTDEYALRKAREENLLLYSGKKNYTIIRPYITYSEIRLQLGIYEKEKWLYRALHGRTIVFSSDIAQHITTLSYGYDVSACLAQLIGNPSAIGETYTITTSESIRWKDVLNIYLSEIEKLTGRKPKVKFIEEPLEYKMPDSKYVIKYDRRFDRSFNNEKITSICNDFVFTKTEDGLRKCIADFIAHPSFHPINFLYEAKHDRITHEITSLKEITGFKPKVSYLLCRFTPYFEIKTFIKTKFFHGK